LLVFLVFFIEFSIQIGQYCPSTGSVAHVSEYDFLLCSAYQQDTCCSTGGEADIENFWEQATEQSGNCQYDRKAVRPLLVEYFCSPCVPNLEDYVGMYPDLTYDISGTSQFALTNSSQVAIVPTLFFCDSWMDQFLGIKYLATVNWTTGVTYNNGTPAYAYSTNIIGTSNYDECGLWNPTQTVCLNNGVFLPGSYYNGETGVANYNQFLHDIQLQSTYNIIGSVSIPDDEVEFYSLQSVMNYPGASVTGSNYPPVTLPVALYNITFPKKCYKGDSSRIGSSLVLTSSMLLVLFFVSLWNQN